VKESVRTSLRRYYQRLRSVPILGIAVDMLAPYAKHYIATRALLKASQPSLETRVQELETLVADLREEQIRAAQEKELPRISVVINTCNRKDYLRNALESLAQQRYPSFEIVVVCGPSDDGTEELLAEWEGRIKILSCPIRNISVSRNIGIEASGGEIVAFMDDDAIAPSNWLLELSRGYENHEVAAVGGYIRDNSGIAWQSRVTVCDRYGDASYYDDLQSACLALGCPEQWGRDRYFSPTGTNMSFRREVLTGLGGFDENYAYYLDETDIFIRIADAGLRTIFQPQAIILHKFAPSHLRTIERIPKNIYLMACSKAYFVMRHALPIHGIKICTTYLDRWIKEAKENIKSLLRQRYINKKDFYRLTQEVDQARQDVEQLIQKSQCLVKFDEKISFLPFLTTKKARRSENIICPDYSEKNFYEIDKVQRQICNLLNQGYEVHIWKRTSQADNIDFINGVWVHSTSNFSKII